MVSNSIAESQILKLNHPTLRYLVKKLILCATQLRYCSSLNSRRANSNSDSRGQNFFVYSDFRLHIKPPPSPSTAGTQTAGISKNSAAGFSSNKRFNILRSVNNK